jgi:PAS domain S-box-containing protein
MLQATIAERERAAETLQKTNLELLAIIDNLPFLAWLKDSEGRFMAVNEAFAHSCGLSSAKEVVGKTDFEYGRGLPRRRLLRMRNRQKKAVGELISDQGMQKWFETYKAPLYEVNGNVIGTTGFSTWWNTWPLTGPIGQPWALMQRWRRSRRTTVSSTTRLLPMPA